MPSSYISAVVQVSFANGIIEAGKLRKVAGPRGCDYKDQGRDLSMGPDSNSGKRSSNQRGFDSEQVMAPANQTHRLQQHAADRGLCKRQSKGGSARIQARLSSYSTGEKWNRSRDKYSREGGLRLAHDQDGASSINRTRGLW